MPRRRPSLPSSPARLPGAPLFLCSVLLSIAPTSRDVPASDEALDALLPLTIEIGDYRLQRSLADLDLLYGGACDGGYAPVCVPGRWRTDGALDPSAAVEWFERLCDDGDAVACVAAGWAAKRGGSTSTTAAGKPDPLFRRACDAGLAQGCHELARTHRQRGDLEDAIRVFEEELALLETEHGEGHEKTGSVLNQLAMTHKQRGDYRAALPFAQRAFQVALDSRGAAHLGTAIAADHLAQVYRRLGRYEEALPLMRGSHRAFEIHKGTDHPLTATAATNLATLYMSRGELDRALPLAEQAAAILADDADQPARERVAALNALALVHRGLGQLDAAEPLLGRALEILDGETGASPDDRGTILNSLASLHRDRGEWEEAEGLYRQVLDLWVAVQGDEHPDVAIARGNLADALAGRGDMDGAVHQLEEALSLRRTALGDAHPAVALTLNNLAVVESDRGHEDRARELHGEALAIRERTLGPEHPSLAVSLTNLALLETAGGELENALERHERARGIEDAHLARDLTLGTTAERRAYLATIEDQTSGTISFHLQQMPGDAGAARLALRTSIRRKGLLVDAEADTAGRLRASFDADSLGLVHELQTLTTWRERLYRAGPSSPEQQASWGESLATYDARIEEGQRELARRSAEYRFERDPPELADVAARLPAGAVLLEFVRYAPLNFGARGSLTREEERYGVYLLRPDGEVEGHDLGSAEDIDGLVTWLHQTLAGGTDPGDLERHVFDALLGKVEGGIGDADHLLISPDDRLHLVPWDALRDPSGKTVHERWLVTGLTSARDLLRGESEAPAGPVLVIAGVTFGVPAPDAPRRWGCSGPWDALPGSEAEGAAILDIWPGAQGLTGAGATETALRDSGSPAVLHVASHGCFDGARPGPAGSRGARRVWAEPAPDDPLPRGPIGDAMFRSAVVLAGANEPPRGDDNGYLTAAEWAALDLRGTELVVLSACETGLGEILSGEGVLGLRRGLVLAGARTQVLSLWKVDDQATAALMEAFHTLLEAGEPRGEALRKAKDALRGTSTWDDPRHWGAFTLSGDWTALRAAPR